MYADRDQPTHSEAREPPTLQFSLVNKYLGDGQGSRDYRDGRTVRRTPYARPTSGRGAPRGGRGSINDVWQHDKFDEIDDDDGPRPTRTITRGSRGLIGGGHVVNRRPSAVGGRTDFGPGRTDFGLFAPRGDVDGPWQHDMFLKTEGHQGTQGTTVVISNLAPDIRSQDVRDLCSEYGRCAVRRFFEVNGHGTAEVHFDNRKDAVQAMNDIDGNELDGDGNILECHLKGPATARGRLTNPGPSRPGPVRRGAPQGGRGGVDGVWKHDKFEGTGGGRPSGGGRPAGVRGRGSVTAQDLDWQLSGY
mmetsp:Transcript_21118/g.37809  ORF Transcript_21118/g.37809 Transcript_21118/m.37809 type:complete len:304 (-) Transcript_21118:1747-2658(-)